MSTSANLTTIADAGAQFMGVLDSGEALSTQQLTDALAAANNLLSSWFEEQYVAFQELVSEQSESIAIMIAQQARAAFPLALAYTLLGGTYTVATYTAPTITPGTAPQFPDTVTDITLFTGLQRALELNVGVELAQQYDVPLTPGLLKIAAEARAAINPMPGRIPVPGMSAASEAPATGAK